MTNRDKVTIGGLSGGVDSCFHPTLIAQGKFAWGENVFCRGGIIQTRPGFKFRASILGSKIQGLTIFTPRNSTPRLLIAVDGKIFVARWPKFEFVQLEGIEFSAAAEQVHFCNTWRSVQSNLDGSVKLITPTPMVFMQDGRTRCAYWDGSTARHTDPSALVAETPQGEWMFWSASRLWVARGTQIFVSNIADPLSFTETRYLAERSNFELPEECTGMIETASGQGLLAFTRHSITAFKSFVPDRTDWGTTPDFQKVIVSGTGTQSGRSIVNQHGMTWFMSDRGFISLDAALNAEQSSELLAADEGMTRSKRKLNANLEGVCSTAFENILLVSVPHGSKYNGHTWVMDQAPLGSRRGPEAWQGIWTGIRPVQWCPALMGGRERLFCVSYDVTAKDDTHIHLWEAFDESREDGNGGRVYCQMETPIISAEKLARFKFAEIEVVEMLGDVDLDIFVGGVVGPWVPIGSKRMQAEKGSMGSHWQPILTKSSLLKAFKPQSRTVRSSEFPTGLDCTPETNGNILGIDTGFAILLQWRGRMGVIKIKAWFDMQTPEEKVGKCGVSESGQFNAVDEGGANITEALD